MEKPECPEPDDEPPLCGSAQFFAFSALAAADFWSR